jgi:hypothetical protein
MARTLTLADGQVAASAASILSSLDAGIEHVGVTFINTGTATETLVVTMRRAGGTARQIARAILSAKESLVLSGVAMQPDDTLLAATTNASAVDYVVTGGSQGPFVAVSHDQYGAVKQAPTTSVGGRVYTNTAASSAVANTATETLFSTSYSMPANTVVAGSLVRIRYQGIATATHAGDTLAIKLYIGGLSGTVLISHAATDVANNDVFSGEMELIVRTVGASGTIVGAGTYKSIPAAEGTMTVADEILPSTTLDTTVAQVIGVSATWSVADVGNSVRLDVLSVEIY